MFNALADYKPAYARATANIPGATSALLDESAVAREYTGLNRIARVTRARGLALGYTLSPASTRALPTQALIPISPFNHQLTVPLAYREEC